jgi:hypothetical protein
MNLKPIKQNMNEVTLRKDNSTYRILFSYQTPVAYIRKWSDGGMVVRRTSKFWSRTTTRHINSWLGELNHCECEQAELDNLLNEVK